MVAKATSYRDDDSMDDDASLGEIIRELAVAVDGLAHSVEGIRGEIARIDGSMNSLRTSVETMDVDVKHLVATAARGDDLKAVSAKLDIIIDKLPGR
jgi:hypothetical protein